MHNLLVPMANLLVKLSKSGSVTINAMEAEQVKEPLNELYASNIEGIRLAVVEVWGAAPELFLYQLSHAIYDPSLLVAVAVVKAFSPASKFRVQLDLAFYVGEDTIQKAVVEMWGSDPMFFNGQLMAAAKNPLLTLKVLDIWARSPMQFNGQLKDLMTDQHTSVRLAVIAAWSQRPDFFRRELRQAYNDADERVRDAVAAIWWSNRVMFAVEIAEIMRIRQQNSTP